MTGRELTEWIAENHAEDMEVYFLQKDGKIMEIEPEVLKNADMKAEYWEARFLPEEGSSVVL